MNAVTHCVGVLLSIVGGRLLSLEVRDTTVTHRISCAIYTVSLLLLYLSSTLFHSFFAMVNTRDVFRVMDKCAIYVLIAGSYTPFMQILLSDQPIYSFGLLGFIWMCCVLGISVEALYPNWKHKTMFSLSMYLGMGVSYRTDEMPMYHVSAIDSLHCELHFSYFAVIKILALTLYFVFDSGLAWCVFPRWWNGCMLHVLT